jgi:hypothetical protein
LISCVHLVPSAAFRVWTLQAWRAEQAGNDSTYKVADNEGLINMILSATAFCKRATCPSSKTLLTYGTQAPSEQMVWVTQHLDNCDFCHAESQLLRKHAPTTEEECTLVEMPSSLRCLAQSLLTADWLHLETLSETAFEKERLTLTDA